MSIIEFISDTLEDLYLVMLYYYLVWFLGVVFLVIFLYIVFLILIVFEEKWLSSIGCSDIFG